MPGLVGMHEHLYYPAPEQGRDGLPFSVEMIDSGPRLYLAAGVTTARTAGSMEPYTDLSLKKLIDMPPSAEAQTRARKLLEQIDGAVINLETIRAIRAIEVLERIDTAESRELLGRLAKGAPGARMTKEAQDSLTRMKK